MMIVAAVKVGLKVRIAGRRTEERRGETYVALEGALENKLLSHTECFVDRKTDQQRRVGLKIRMGVGGRWVWLRSSIGLQISKVATAPATRKFWS